MFPDADHLLARLRDPADPVAPSDFAAAAVPWLLHEMRSRHRGADEHLLVQAVGEAIFSLLCNPAAFDGSRSSLASYLKMAADGDLRNAQAREARHRPALRVHVELDEVLRNEEVEGPPRWEDFPALEAVRDALPPADRAVLDRMRQGDGHAAFAAALGVAHLPLDEQRQAVKRAKDRVLQRLKRARGEP